MAAGGSANATVATNKRKLIRDFIFEVADSGRETTVGSHVWVANQAETQFEVERLVERLLLKDAGPDHLAGDRRQHFVLARGKNVYSRNLRLLMKLLGAKLNCFTRVVVLSLLQRGLEKHLSQQIRVVKVLWVAFEERDCRQFSLLNV